MRIIITDTAFIWNYENPVLEQLKGIVLVVCLDGKRVSDQYECFISPCSLWKHGLGMDKFGIEGRRYKALESVADELNRALGYHGRRNRILILRQDLMYRLSPVLTGLI